MKEAASWILYGSDIAPSDVATLLCLRRTGMYGSDTATLVDWSLMQHSH